MAAHGSVGGALIFWFYIVAALTFTAVILYTIINDGQFKTSPNLRREKTVFACLAATSFVCLSYNMMHVLILSYLEWETVHRPIVPLRYTAASSTLGLTDIARRLWHWSTTSTLFQDFGQALISREDGWAWSHAALMTTGAQMIIAMSVQGQMLAVPRLWMLFVLAEILPISFSQNLFYLICLPRVRASRGRRVRHSWFKSLLRVAYLFCYMTVVNGASRSGEKLIPVILMARSLLILSLFLPLPANVSSAQSQHASTKPAVKEFDLFTIAMPLGLAVFFYYWLHKLYTNASGLHCHPAVSTLGYDFIISSVSSVAWLYLA